MANVSPSNKEIQNDEIEAIKAIFMEEFSLVNPPPNSKKQAKKNLPLHHFILRLCPYKSENHSEIKKEISVELEIKFSRRYPHTSPQILSVKNLKGIDSNLLSSLSEILHSKTQTLKGKEMVYELATEVQEWLTSQISSLSLARTPPLISSYEQMKYRQAVESTMRANEERKKIEEEQKQLQKDMEEKYAKLNKHIEEELERKEKLKKQYRKKLESEISSWFQMSWPPSISEKFTLNRPVAHFPDDPDSPLFQSLIILKKLVFPTYVLLLCSECSSEMLVFVLVSNSTRSLASSILYRLKQFSITSSMSTLHPNILRIYDFMLHTDGKSSKLLILEEATTDYTLYKFLNLSYKLEIRIACGYMCQLLKALSHLHEFTIHGKLDLHQVFLCDSAVIKLSCLSIFIPSYSIRWPDEWKSTNSNEKAIDVYYAACIFLTMICGAKILEWYTPSTVIEIWEYSSSLTASRNSGGALEAKEMKNTLSKLPKNLKETLMTMLNFQAPPLSNLSFFFLSLSHRIQSLSTSHSLLLSEAPILYSPSQYPLLDTNQPPAPAIMSSRYASDFEELESIGKGGFGQVVKAKNKLDGRTYAIKKVKLSPVVYDNRRILREVRAVSRLNSFFCVRYYQAWLEDAQGLWIDEESNSEFSAVSDSELSSSALTTSPSTSSMNASEKTNKKDLKKSGHPLLSPEHTIATWSSSSPPLSENEDSPSISSDSGTSLMPRKGSASNHQLSSPKILYIQMELCENRTLSDVIEKGLPLNETWRLFRQILEGLAYIHSLGFIHRDLKPKNIFLDAKNNVKIGDFGLATTFFYDPEVNEVVQPSSDSHRSLTSDIGTSTYIAPEVTTSQTKYNQKVDMYSLGIILFELAYRFSTGMERVMALRNLRSSKIIFPSDYPDSDSKKIIQWLLNHDPSLRPTSLELLQSKWIPSTIEDKYIQEALRTVTNPENTSYFTKLLDMLYSQPVDPLKSFTYDDTNKHVPSLLATIAGTCEIMTRVFQCHGAISFQAPLLVPKDQFFVPKFHAQFLDPHGNFVCLPSDAILSFARYVARNHIQNFKRYTICPIFKENTIGGQPISSLEATFDIIASSSLQEAYAPTLEVIQCTFQILDALVPIHRQNYYLILNHLALAEAIFHMARLSSQQKSKLIELLETVCNKTNVTHEISFKLSEFLPRKSVDLIVSFLKLETDINLIANRLPESTKEVTNTLKRLSQYLSSLGIHCPIYFCPLFTLQYSYYRNQLVFQVRLTNALNKVEILASGGRYDTLVMEFIHPSLRTPKEFEPMAVGVRLNMKKLISTFPSTIPPSKPLSGTLVLVASFTSGLTMERIKLAKELWKAGIACEVVYEDQSSMDKLFHHCKQFQIPYLLFVKHETSGTVKLRSLRTRTETELMRNDVVHYLSSEIDADEVNSFHHPFSILTTPGSSVQASSPNTLQNTRLVQWVALPNSKKLNPKQTTLFSDKALASVNKLLADLYTCPILVIPSLSSATLSSIAFNFQEKRPAHSFSHV
ncbi:hypothetical protein HMI55_000409 [Coelomomyces lativittatus]|nr:hypothetical protein HMI55_000409 [Coelomomyces lativittatus]